MANSPFRGRSAPGLHPGQFSVVSFGTGLGGTYTQDCVLGYSQPELSKLASKSGFMGSHPLMEWKGTNFKEIGLGYLTLVGIGVRARLPPGLTRISCSLLSTGLRMRLSSRKAARGSLIPLSCTGNPGIVLGHSQLELSKLADGSTL